MTREELNPGGPLKLVPRLLLGLGLLIWACGRDGTIPPGTTSPGGEPPGGEPPGEASGAPPRSLRALLIEGVAHAEIQEWPRALELFQQAAALAPEEPVAVFDVAVAHFQAGDARLAREQLEHMPETAPPWLLGRVSYLRGKLAAEEGDREGVQAAYRDAARLDPAEAVYPHALAEFQRRQPRRRGCRR